MATWRSVKNSSSLTLESAVGTANIGFWDLSSTPRKTDFSSSLELAFLASE
jgi:hypothetical protein